MDWSLAVLSLLLCIFRERLRFGEWTLPLVSWAVSFHNLPRTCSNPVASASQELGLWLCGVMLGYFLLAYEICLYFCYETRGQWFSLCSYSFGVFLSSVIQFLSWIFPGTNWLSPQIHFRETNSNAIGAWSCLIFN